MSTLDMSPYGEYFESMGSTESWYGSSEIGFEDAFYPSTWEYFFEGLNPTKMYGDMEGTSTVASERAFFDGLSWSSWANRSYYIPWLAITMYLIVLFGLEAFMKNREPLKLRTAKVFWNFGLSIFSFVGFFICSFKLLFDKHQGVLVAGLEKSVCTHTSNYGYGWCGFMVASFCFSKCFELIDTVWLLLAKREIIFLHYYHHITVLAFCWYAYSVRASNGLYFAVVNYMVHMIMYFYYGMTQLGPKYRAMVRPYAIYITFLQLSQMVFGLLIVGLTIYYKYHRIPCYTFPHVNLLAIIMYASYFVLFLDIFLRRYVFAKSKKTKRA